jgi:hypothetical protein
VVNFETNIKMLEECWLEDLVGELQWKLKVQLPAVPQNYSPYTPQATYQPTSIPSSPVYHEPSYSYGYASSPITSSPIKHAHESIWSSSNPAAKNSNNNIWTYTPSYQYVPNNGPVFAEPTNNYIQFRGLHQPILQLQYCFLLTLFLLFISFNFT